MAGVLPKLIHDNQRCVPGRKITKNIHIVQDLIDVINKNNSNGALIFLDQEKLLIGFHIRLLSKPSSLLILVKDLSIG